MNFVLFAVVSLLIGASLALYFRKNDVQISISLISQAIALVLLFVVTVPVLMNGIEIRGLVRWSFPINDINLRIDPLSAFFLLFSIPMTLLGSLYARGYLSPYFAKGRNGGLHFAILNMVSLSYILIYTVENAIVFLLGWEIAAISAWLLVIWDYRNQKIRFAGFNYLVSTHIGLLFLIAALLLLHSSTRSFDFQTFGTVLSQPGPIRNIIFVLFVTSFALKSAFFPFHTWLPRAHSAAPAHVSALMSGVIHKAGLFGLLRLTLIMGTPDEWMGWFLIGFSALSAFTGVLYTVTQRDLKRLLGYSSTENVGIAGIGIGLGYLGLVWKEPLLVAFGFSGAVLHILNHALFKCLLFYAAGAIYRMAHTVDLERLGGLIKKMPQTASFYLIGGLAISAVPPFNGFVSEFLIYNGLLRRWNGSLYAQGALMLGAALLSLTGAISAVAIVRSFGISFLGAQRDPSALTGGEAPLSMRFSMAIHTLGVILLGVVPFLGVSIIQCVTKEFIGLLPDVSLTSDIIESVFGVLKPLSAMNLSLILVTAVVLFARRWSLGRGVRRHITWACGYPNTNSRMQYTGASFSDPFVCVFKGMLKLLKRENLPHELFPRSGYLNTHFVDAVERRMFKMIGEAEQLFESIAVKIREESHVSFGLGLIVILGAMALLLMKNGII